MLNEHEISRFERNDQPARRPSRDRLTARDRADLEAYAEVLRPFYGIPEGHPVFPPVPRRVGHHRTASRPQRVATGVNPASHPWRGHL
jgi:hypothetical protein